MSLGILVVEDEAILAKNIRRYLEQHGYEVRIAADGRAGVEQFEDFKPDLIVLDYNLPELNGLEVLERIRRIDSRVKVILITAHGNVQVAVEAMKAGAHDYLSKPVVLRELKLLIDKAVGQERLEGELSYYRGREADAVGLDYILGESAPIAELKQRVRQLLEAERRLTDDDPPAVLITGETGTGKELFARALHFDGARREHPFVEVNCAAIPAHLVESELFGYERGAFTDARERKLGLVESAHGGTLFLDEIGDLAPAVQAKLLKLLEDKTVRRLGSVRDHRVNVRIITATNRSLEQLVENGEFRSDLYFRLRVVTLALPPLRERGEDIALLAETFLAHHGRRYGKSGLSFDPEARRVLLSHDWPGNIRELRNVVEQAVLLTPDRVIRPEHLSIAPARAPLAARHQPARAESEPSRTKQGTTLKEVERDMIAKALEDCAGNVTRAARTLGITRDTLRYRMEKYGL